MQNAVHKMDSTSRYNSNDSSSSHGSVGTFPSGPYRSNGPHNESTRVPNQNTSYGAQFNSTVEKYSCEGENGNSESPYSGWQNMNTSATNNNWNIPEGKPVMGRSIHGNRGDNSAKEENMMPDSDTSSFSGLLGATGGTENFSDEKANANNNFTGNASRPPHMPRLGLLGGGESSMVAPSANWSGSQGPTSTSSSTWGNRQNSNTDLTGDSNGGASNKPQGSWAQAAGKGLSPGSGIAQNVTAEPISAQPESSAPRDRAEQEAHELRMKVAYSQGWGPQGVNQDTAWEVDEPPLEGGKEASPMWRPPINNGTDIWENNLRMNKGSGPPTVPVPTTTAPPWGHTPATNIGGHWGDDESSPSTWNSGALPGGNPNPGNWAEQNPAGGNNMWASTAPGDKQWNSNRSSWGDGNSDSASWSSRNPQLGNWSPAATPKKELPPSNWEPTSPPPVRRPPVGTGYDDGTAVWGNPGRQGKVSHWKDMPSAKPIMNSGGGMMGPNGMMPPSGPGMIRIPTAGKGDGSWNKPPPTRGSNWQDMPPHRDSPSIGSWNEDNQMKNLAQGSQYNMGWNDQNNPMCWGAKPKANSNWADGQVDTSSWLGPAKQRSEMAPQGWSEDMSEKNNLKNDSRRDVVGNWTEASTRPYESFVGRKLKGGKPLCKDIVHASKQFRILTEYGYRKEDVENALRNNNMNLDDAAAELQAMTSGTIDVDGFGGRKVRPASMYEDMPLTDHNMDSFTQNNFHTPNNFSQNSLNFTGFKQQAPKVPANSNVVNSVMGGQQLASGNLSPALIQKLLQQQQQQQQSLQLMNLNTVPPIGNHKFTTNAQLRHLVQQIQMAVQAGHLNAQILNQPLAPPTLQLLYQLLQQIKALSSLHQQQLLQSSHLSKQGIPGNNAATLQTNVQIAQAKSRIANLQNQICAQQALFLKQQQLPPQQQQPIQSHHGGSQPTTDIFKPDSLPGLHSDFRDLTLKDMSHQSRLNQWKLSSMDKEDDINHSGNSGDFSRAPGPLNSKQTTNSAIHPLLEQSDNTWSGLTGRESGWPDSVPTSADCANVSGSSLSSSLGGGQTSDRKDGTHTSTSVSGTSSYLTDLVPEFEPGKPWKGTQLKNIEDDPHITPGSIARSPLSVNNIKESNLFWPPKSSPANTEVPSNTWGYNPQAANSSSANMKSGKSSWSPDFTTESWHNNPPPSLPSGQGWDRQYNSTFLILKNLTPQIDGSTLKTLCMQHGPLQMFHLFLSRGVALVRYSTREEANKAQSALDNCVLSNTTMLADIPSESEVQQYLQVSSGQQSTGSSNSWPTPPPTAGSGSASYQGGSSAFYGSGNTTGTSNWNSNGSQLWSFSNSSLWGSAQPSSDHDGSTNPINYLPNDLLGGEPL